MTCGLTHKRLLQSNTRNLWLVCFKKVKISLACISGNVMIHETAKETIISFIFLSETCLNLVTMWSTENCKSTRNFETM